MSYKEPIERAVDSLDKAILAAKIACAFAAVALLCMIAVLVIELSSDSHSTSHSSSLHYCGPSKSYTEYCTSDGQPSSILEGSE